MDAIPKGKVEEIMLAKENLVMPQSFFQFWPSVTWPQQAVFNKAFYQMQAKQHPAVLIHLCHPLQTLFPKQQG